MKRKISIIFIICITILVSAFTFQHETEPWKPEQLMQPAELAEMIAANTTKQPLILNIGFDGEIKNSIEIGAASEKAGLENLKNKLNKLPKDTALVIYCGCCPFEHCPNIRPAFQLLNKMKFTNHKLLNLTHNLKVDWIEKGYPLKK